MLVSKKKKLSKQEDRQSSESLLDASDCKHEQQNDELIERIEQAMLEQEAPFNDADEESHEREINDSVSVLNGGVRQERNVPSKPFLPSLSSESTEADGEFREQEDSFEVASTVRLSTQSRKLQKSPATEDGFSFPSGEIGVPNRQSFAPRGVTPHPVSIPTTIKSQKHPDPTGNQTRKGLIYIRMKVLFPERFPIFSVAQFLI